jgi:ABC-type polysaccharide/polyol phosphate export permease
VLENLRRLIGYRALIQSLVARELKARYRGSALGFLWSFVNPLLLLSIYTFVFTVVLPGARGSGLEPYALFMFCGLLPWIWFSSSLLESSTVLVSAGNLIRKVLFPPEILPIVAVLAGFVHFCLGMLIVAGALLYNRIDVWPSDLLWLPFIVVVQLTLTLGLALLVSVITVHFRDMRDLLSNLLQLLFFATPILYPLTSVPEHLRLFLKLNPFTHLAIAYQQVLFVEGPFLEWRNLVILAGCALVVLVAGFAFFDRLRDTLPEAV